MSTQPTSAKPRHDVAIVGGGIMGATVALELARAGLSVVLVERRPGLCMEASSANTGALMLQLLRAAFMPYAMHSIERWRTASEWLGFDLGYHRNGGLTVAFDEDEAAMLEAWMGERRDRGAPIEIIDGDRARELEPALGDDVKLASYCELDGYADATITGRGFHQALMRAGVDLRPGTPVRHIDGGDRGYRLHLDRTRIDARRLVLTGGVWLGRMLGWLDLDIPIECRVNQVIVTGRMPPLLRRSVCAVTGRLSLKQSRAGTFLVGGGWQGRGDPDRGGEEIVPEHLIANLRLACHAIPAMRDARVVRGWLGLEAKAADYMPVMGALPGRPDAWALGAVHGGYSLAPCLGKLLAQAVLGDEPDLPIPVAFSPRRLLPENRAGLAPW